MYVPMRKSRNKVSREEAIIKEHCIYLVLREVQ